MVKLSAFADEITDEFAGQIEFLVKENIRYIEPRFFDGHKNIMDLTASEMKEAKKRLDDNGIGVSAIGSPIGKIRLDEPFKEHLDRFRHAVELADCFETKHIRIFSYYAPEGQNISIYRDEVIERMRRKVEIIKDVDIVMVLENEKHLYGQTPEKCAELITAVNSPKLRLCYDPANFVVTLGAADNIQTCWPVMKPYVAHIHIKDWKAGAEIGSMPGQGDARIELLLKELVDIEYAGFITLEPHLQQGGQYGGVTGPELFVQAIKETLKMAYDAGLAIE